MSTHEPPFSPTRRGFLDWLVAVFSAINIAATEAGVAAVGKLVADSLKAIPTAPVLEGEPVVGVRRDRPARGAQSIFDQVIALCGTDVTYASILEALHIVDQEVYFRVTDLITTQDAAGALALVDELTGLANRRGFAFFAEAEARNLRMIGGKILMDRNAPEGAPPRPSPPGRAGCGGWPSRRRSGSGRGSPAPACGSRRQRSRCG